MPSSTHPEGAATAEHGPHGGDTSSFLPPISFKSSSSDSDMEAMSGSPSPGTRRSSRGSSLNSSPTKLPSIDRSSSNSVSSTASFASMKSQRQIAIEDRICRSPSCPSLSADFHEDSLVPSNKLLPGFQKHRASESLLGLKLPDIHNIRDTRMARFMANKREQWLDKHSMRKRNSVGTPKHAASTDVSDLMISPRNNVHNPLLLPMDASTKKESDGKKGKKKKVPTATLR